MNYFYKKSDYCILIEQSELLLEQLECDYINEGFIENVIDNIINIIKKVFDKIKQLSAAIRSKINDTINKSSNNDNTDVEITYYPLDAFKIWASLGVSELSTMKLRTLKTCTPDEVDQLFEDESAKFINNIKQRYNIAANDELSDGLDNALNKKKVHEKVSTESLKLFLREFEALLDTHNKCINEASNTLNKNIKNMKELIGETEESKKIIQKVRSYYIKYLNTLLLFNNKISAALNYNIENIKKVL